MSGVSKHPCSFGKPLRYTERARERAREPVGRSKACSGVELLWQ